MSNSCMLCQYNQPRYYVTVCQNCIVTKEKPEGTQFWLNFDVQEILLRNGFVRKKDMFTVANIKNCPLCNS